MAGLIGALRVTLSADTAQFTKGMTNAQRQARRSSSDIQKSLAKVKSDVGGMKASIASMIAGLTVGAFASMAREALNFAGALGETAKQTGVTVEQLQILTRAAIANGVSQDSLTASLARLNAKLGEAKAGSKEAIKLFADLGISKEQLDSFQQAGDALPHVMEGIKRLGVSSLQAAAAKRLLGKAAGQLLPILDQGAAGYSAMAKEAEKAGLITAEQAARADEAADKLDLLAYSVKTNLTGAFIDMLPVIEAVIRGLGNLISTAASAISWLDRVGTPGTSGGGKRGGNLTSIGMKAANAINPMLLPMFGLATGSGGGKSGGKSGPLWRIVGNYATGDRNSLGNEPSLDLDLSGGGGGGGGRKGGGAGDAERRRKELLRDAFDIASDQRRADIDILRAKQDIAVEHQDRAELDRQILELEYQQELAALDLSVKMGDTSEAQAAILRAKLEEVHGLKQIAVTQEIDQRKREELAQLQDTDLELQRDALEGQAELARTAAERRKIELEILALAYDEKRQALDRIRLDPLASAKDQQDAIARLAGLDRRQAQDKAALYRGTMGPMETFLDRLPKTAAEAREALETVAVDGFGTLTDELSNAVASLVDFGGKWGRLVNQIIADLARLAIQQGLAALFNMGGGSFGGGGGLAKGLSSGGTGALKGFASGGAFRVGGMAGVDSNILSVNGSAVARVSRGERVKVTPANDRGDNAIEVRLSLDNDMLRAEVVQTSTGVVLAAAPGIRAGAGADMLKALTRPQLSSGIR